MAPQAVHVAVDISSGVGTVAGAAKTGAKITSAISMTQAFRQYDWLHLKPLTNASGDLRGMVINAKARSVFDIAIKGKNAADLVGNLAAIVVAIASVYDESVAIVNSNDAPNIKAAKLSDQVASAALRGITGILIVPEVLTLTHGISWVSRQAASRFPSQQGTLNNVAQFADDYSTNVVKTFQTFTDGNNIYNYVQIIVNAN